MSSPNNYSGGGNDSAVNLQVCSRRFITTRATLTGKSGYFADMFARGKWPYPQPRDRAYLIDADPDLFQHILYFLRRGVFPLSYEASSGHNYWFYTRLLEEAKYFRIPALVEWLASKKYEDAVRFQVEVDARNVSLGGEVYYEKAPKNVAQERFFMSWPPTSSSSQQAQMMGCHHHHSCMAGKEAEEQEPPKAQFALATRTVTFDASLLLDRPPPPPGPPARAEAEVGALAGSRDVPRAAVEEWRQLAGRQGGQRKRTRRTLDDELEDEEDVVGKS